MRSALAEFRTEIARIDGVASLLNTPDALQPAMINPSVAVRCGSVVLLSGYFENFLRDCMCSFIGVVNGLGKPISMLPSPMKMTHFEVGARVLGRELRKARASGDTSACEDLALRLSSVSAATGYSLVWEAFAETNANPGPTVVRDLLKAVGVEDPWRKLKATTVLGGLGAVDTFLTSFIEMRNECAHTGNTTSPPTPTDLQSYGQNLSALAEAIVVILEARGAELAAL